MIRERRRFPRKPIRSLFYVSLGARRGGIVYNLSEAGFAVELAGAPLGSQTLPMQFDLPETQNHIEANGRVIWTSPQGDRVGIEFLDLPEASKQQIREWLALRSDVVEHEDQTTLPVSGRERAPVTGLWSDLSLGIAASEPETPLTTPPLEILRQRNFRRVVFAGTLGCLVGLALAAGTAFYWSHH